MNSERRPKDMSGNPNKMFMPSTIDSSVEDGFLTGGKLAMLVIIAVAMVLLTSSILGGFMNWVAKTISMVGVTYAAALAFRKGVLSENYYMKVYRDMQEYSETTPALFWDIASIKDTDEGMVFVYSDTKIGVLVELDRDTITGREDNFEETHYDAVSDFYRLLGQNGYSFVRMGMMEAAGSDPRIDELDKLSQRKRDNPNLTILLEEQISYIKKLNRNTLYDRDYILIYTYNIGKAETIAIEAKTMIARLKSGAYKDANVLGAEGVNEFIRNKYGIKHFNMSEAMLGIYAGAAEVSEPAFEIIAIKRKDSTVEYLGEDSIEEYSNEEIAGDGILSAGNGTDECYNSECEVGNWELGELEEVVENDIEKMDDEKIDENFIGCSDIGTVYLDENFQQQSIEKVKAIIYPDDDEQIIDF